MGSCEDLVARLNRHNLGKVPAMKLGIPSIILHSEVFETRREAVGKELYYKIGRGRDELNRLRDRSPRRPTSINCN